MSCVILRVVDLSHVEGRDEKTRPPPGAVLEIRYSRSDATIIK
jgi:hypothetical protein